MFKPVKLRVNRQKMGKTPREHVVDGGTIVFSWGAVSDAKNAYQTAFRLTIRTEDDILLDTGRIASDRQEYVWQDAPLPSGKKIVWSVVMEDSLGNASVPAEEYFYIGNIKWTAKWIAADQDIKRQTVYFRHEFHAARPVKSACLYACGIGYHEVSINGVKPDDALLDPAHTSYEKLCQYAVIPEVGGLLNEGINCIGVILGEGWRRNEGTYLKNAKPVTFFGMPQLSLMLVVVYEDGTDETIATDESWECGRGPITENNLFDGETYDANRSICGWNLCGYRDFVPVRMVDAPCGEMRPMLIPPIREMRTYKPVSLSQPEDGVYLVDLGQNIAGVIRMKLSGLCEGQTITIKHMELLDEDGKLYLPNLRGAKATDMYIASGDERDLTVWQPKFTYHGFRYAQIEGFMPEYDTIEAIQLHTDLDTASDFRCGSALVSRIHQNVVMTERDNMHSILTDCPQRDERMGWMNDATVRFEETPYNFDVGAMFRKIVRDLSAGQREDGAISCTAPYVYGSYPADPVCSSYLVAAMQALLHNGDAETIAENFINFCAWEQCLLDNSSDFIVNYSYYGDWAGPAYACEGEDGAKSAVTPGEFMSTGFSYFNCTLLSSFARLLNRADDAEKYTALADNIKTAILKKWYDPARATMATGSQACQAFSLWLMIIPEVDCERAAKVMRDDLVSKGYRFTTGNLCTRYMLDMLAKYGYIDDAWKLMTSEEYPSYGHMIQQEATTIWERFELKKNWGMNSHNHPMYGSCGYWLYAYIAGIRPTGAGYETVEIRPYLPEKLMSAQATLDTVKGRLNVKWVKRYGEAHMYVDIPFGVAATVYFGGKEYISGSGTYHYSFLL